MSNLFTYNFNRLHIHAESLKHPCAKTAQVLPLYLRWALGAAPLYIRDFEVKDSGAIADYA